MTMEWFIHPSQVINVTQATVGYNTVSSHPVSIAFKNVFLKCNILNSSSSEGIKKTFPWWCFKMFRKLHKRSFHFELKSLPFLHLCHSGQSAVQKPFCFNHIAKLFLKLFCFWAKCHPKTHMGLKKRLWTFNFVHTPGVAEWQLLQNC